MPRVKIIGDAIVRDVNCLAGRVVDLDDDAAKDVVASKVGVIVGDDVALNTAEDVAHVVARKAVKHGRRRRP